MSDRYLIVYNDAGAVVELNTRDTTADRFGQIQRAFASLAGAKGDDWPYATMLRLYPESVTPSGVPYHWELSGPDGASYMLCPLPENTREQIDDAKRYIRRSFDVVRLSSVGVRRWVEFDPAKVEEGAPS